MQKNKLSKAIIMAAFSGLLVSFSSAGLAVTDSATRGVRAVYVSKSANASVITPTLLQIGTWVDVPGSAVVVNRPSNTDELYIARFSAESLCTGTIPSWCQVRIVAGTTELSPVVGADYAFDSTWNGTRPVNSWMAKSMERSASFTGPCSGTASTTFKVQYKVNAVGLSFRLDDWHFTVEAVSKGNLFTC